MRSNPFRRSAAAALSRRGFLAGALAAAAAAPHIVPASALGFEGEMPPSERIAIGMLGVGNRGSGSLAAMRPLPDHQVVAIADCRRPRALRAQEEVNRVYAERLGKQDFRGCEIYNDFRELLARDDIDAVWGCVPDHWHGVVYSRVIEAGKDMYGEKPVSRWIADGIKVRDAVRRYGCVFQTGTQQRSDPKFRRACELARNGYLGKVHTVYVGAPGGRSYPAVPPCDPPEGFDYDMWTGPAPFIPFDAQRCEWLAMYMISHYCAGFITNWGEEPLAKRFMEGYGGPGSLKHRVAATLARSLLGAMVPSRNSCRLFEYPVILESPIDCEWLSGSNLSIRRAAFEATRFETDLEGYSLGEDVLLSRRVRALGRLSITPDARCRHHWSPSGSPQRTLLGEKEAIFFRRLLGFRGRIILLNRRIFFRTLGYSNR